MTDTDHWRPTSAHVRAVVCGLAGVVVAVLARRPDVLVLATPFVVVAAWSALARPTTAPVIDQSIGHAVLHEGQSTGWSISVDDPEGRIDVVAAVLETPERVERDPVDGQRAVSLHDEGHEALRVTVRPTRWGRHTVLPATVVASSTWGAFRWIAHGPLSRTIVSLPHPSDFDASAPPVHTPGLVGLSRSPRPGSGTEFASIRPFQPGDRLRRVHWPQTLRTGVTHVRSTWADHDRHVVLLVDALADVGGSGGVDGAASSLDITMRAAAAIAQHYAGSGDRVSLVLMGQRGVQRVPPGTGFRHLRRILEVLATTEPTEGVPDPGRVPRGLGDGELVVLLSPLLSLGAVQRAVTVADRGITLVAVDCLPPGITVDHGGDPYAALAWRIELLERERRLRQAREAGIAVVPWSGPGSLDLVLRDLQRHAGSRRGGHR